MAEFTIDSLRDKLAGNRPDSGDGEERGHYDRPILAVLALVGVAVLAFTVLRGDGAAGDSDGVVAVSHAGTAAEADAGSDTNPDAAGAEAAAQPPARQQIRVHVAGAVAHPGVFTLAAGTIAVEAIAAAGGPLPQAELARVNLAAKVSDGQQLFVPVAGEPAPQPSAAAVAGSVPQGPVDLNTADIAALDSLPGIGQATAAKIVAHREEHGPFKSPRDLLDVPGIGEAKLAALADLVTT